MASSDRSGGAVPGAGEGMPPGKPTTLGQKVLDKGAQMMQSLKPVKRFHQHALLLRSMLMTWLAKLRPTLRHSSQPGFPPYIITDRIFKTLPAEEQRLWHSHAYEIKSGLWASSQVPEMVYKPDLENMVKTYGMFWCTWCTSTKDITSGCVNLGMVMPGFVQRRDHKHGISTPDLKETRLIEIPEPEWINPNADYWKQHGKGFTIDVVLAEMKLKSTISMNIVCLAYVGFLFLLFHGVIGRCKHDQISSPISDK
ncbi:Oil body-associated protein-like [Dillenia turbinata]|uniref:Oil body-associated protein-like n=1 Tax=Dillenia turbinata TaxID=194707 RepID=A0AAN8UTH7_9MAGN